MEIRTNPKRKAQAINSVSYGKGVSHYHLPFGRDSRAGGAVESCLVENRGGSGLP